MLHIEERLLVSQIAVVLLLVTFCFFSPAFATTFVALVTDQEGIVAFDSKRTSTLSGHAFSQSPICKIITGNRSIYAIAGMSGSGDLNAYKIIAPLATGKPDALLSIQNALLTMIQTALPHMSEEELTRYINTGVPLTVVIAIVFDKVPSLYEILFYLNPDRSVRPQVVRQKNPALMFSEEAMKPLVPENWSDIDNKIPLVHSLMSVGIAANPISAGPISIIRLNAYGLQWIESGVCIVRR